jgi:NitT/TauT family transport system substrate-binding protein
MIDRRGFMALGGAWTAALLVPPSSAFAGGAITIRLTSVNAGSVSWLIETMRAEALDKKYGIELSVIEVANNQAAPVALLAGEADVTVSDWMWALKQRSKGQDYKFASYSSALGALVVPKDSPIKSIAGLEGKKLGVAGSATDKSWILMRAYSKKVIGKDLGQICDTVFGAAPLVTEEFKSGRLDACLNFWTYAARLTAAGARQIVTMADVIKALDISPTPPLVGFIWSEKAVKDKAVPIEGLLAAANDANAVLAKSDEAWEKLRPLIKPATEQEFASIKAGFRAGITQPWSAAETASAEKLTKLLMDLGDTELVGDGTRFDPNLFHTKTG